MFLLEKYRPYDIHDFLFNKEILSELIYIASHIDIPHIIIAGPPGGGKKTLAKIFLEYVYDSDVNNLKKVKYPIVGPSTKKEIEIMQSNYHIVIEPTNTNHDKYILQCIIKQYTMYKTFDIFKTKRKFKTIVINNIENLANNSQSALRRTMELYAKSCRFIMICNNLSKIFDPLRSRCLTFCVPTPSTNDIKNVIYHMSIMEKIQLSNNDFNSIIDCCNGRLSKAIWTLDCIRLNCNKHITLDQVFDSVVQLILSVKNRKSVVQIFDIDIRTCIYNILITNIKGTDIIITLMDKLISKVNNDSVNTKIIQCASEAEYNLIHGRRDILNIDYFICGAMKEIRNNL